MQFKVSMNKKPVLTGLQAENIEQAVSKIESLMSNFIKIQETVVEDEVAILFLEDNRRMIISQDKEAKAQKAADPEDLMAIIQKDEEKGRIICSTVKGRTRRATKAPDEIRRKFSNLGGKFKEMTITKKAGWQFMPDKEDELRNILLDAGIAIEE